jgi:hypothetical protein
MILDPFQFRDIGRREFIRRRRLWFCIRERMAVRPSDRNRSSRRQTRKQKPMVRNLLNCIPHAGVL